MASGRRTAGTLLLTVGVGACGAEPPHQAAHLPLVDRADRLRVEVDRPIALGEEVGLAWLRAGFAGISLELERSAATDGEWEGFHFARWVLPLPLAAAAGAAGFQADLVGIPIPRIVPGVAPHPDQVAGFWVRGRELVIAWHGRDDVPARFSLVYPVFAAHLAGTALAAGFPSEEVFRVRRNRGGVSVECLALPASATLRLELPPLPGGVLSADFTALASRPRPPDPVPVVRVLLEGEEVFAVGLDPDGPPVPLRTGLSAGLALEPTAEERVLELRVDGPPGALVFAENPLFTRGRNWMDRPNVLLIVVDTLRADRLGCNGSRRRLTPSLDRLAAESIVFEQCWSTAPRTLPSIESILTSTHGAGHLAWCDDRRLGGDLTTLAEVYRCAGYRTAAFTGGGFVDPAFGLERGFMLFDARGGGVQAVADRARAFVEGSGSGPWFVLLHTLEVHAPYEPPERVFQAVLRRYGEVLRGREPHPKSFLDLAASEGGVPRDVARALEVLYDEEIRHTDDVLGSFLRWLGTEGLFEGSVVCVTSDHGEEFGEHGRLGHGETLYREALHVPLILHLPRGERGGKSDPRPVSLIDLAPTLLHASELGDLAGETTFVGISLLEEECSPVYALRNHPDLAILHATREGSLVAIEGLDTEGEPRGIEGTQECFDLSSDGGQQRNLVTSPLPAPLRQAFKQLEVLSRRYGRPRTEDAPVVLEALAEVARRGLD